MLLKLIEKSRIFTRSPPQRYFSNQNNTETCLMANDIKSFDSVDKILYKQKKLKSKNLTILLLNFKDGVGI